MSDKQNDVDALLASLTDPNATPEKKKSSNSFEHHELETFGERSASFKIDPRDSHITGTDKLRKDALSLSVNPEDFRNHLEAQKETKKRRKLFIILGIALFVLTLGASAYSLIQSATSQAVYVIPSDETESQRFLNLYPDAPMADTTVSTFITVTENGLSIPNGYTLTFAGMEFESLDYQAVEASDFGPAAVANVEGEWNGTTVYLFKDMAHSKAFANAWDGAPVDIEGAAAAATMLMELPTGVHAVLAIVNPDSTGFMIVLPQNLNYASAENLKDFVRIEQSVSQSSTE